MQKLHLYKHLVLYSCMHIIDLLCVLCSYICLRTMQDLQVCLNFFSFNAMIISLFYFILETPYVMAPEQKVPRWDSLKHYWVIKPILIRYWMINNWWWRHKHQHLPMPASALCTAWCVIVREVRVNHLQSELLRAWLRNWKRRGMNWMPWLQQSQQVVLIHQNVSQFRGPWMEDYR